MTDITAQIALKPCPFCGAIPLDDNAVHPNNDCALNGVVFTKEEWNTQAGEKAAVLTALEEACRRGCVEYRNSHDNKIESFVPPIDGDDGIWWHGPKAAIPCNASKTRKLMEEIKNG